MTGLDASQFTERLKVHNENPNTHHMLACISTQYMLLATAYAVEAELCSEPELNWDCMGGIVQEFVDLLAFVVPYCRGLFHVWGFAITPDK